MKNWKRNCISGGASRLIRNGSRNVRLVLVKTALCAGIPTFAGISQPQNAVASVYDLARQAWLVNRVSSAPEAVLNKFSDQLKVNLFAHLVTSAERGIVADALAQLTPLHREVLLKRLRAIYFIDGLPKRVDFC